MTQNQSQHSDNAAISEDEAQDIEEHARLSTPVIYEIVRQEGREEMERPVTSLWWSGLAAGLSMSFSTIAQAMLYHHLPDAGWRPLVAGFGYTVGFLIVILARQQLFTENTITVVLPLLKDFTARNLALTGRLWGVVLVANFAGTLAAALFCTYTQVLSPELYGAAMEVSEKAMAHGWSDMLVRGVAAGFLIAALVWLIPSAKGSETLVIILITYVIAIGEFAHIIAGGMEAFLLVLGGKMAVGQMAWGFFVPTLLGNVIGGTALFALISHAQVMEEI